MSDDKNRPTIVIKKIKKGGHGAHGGAWKVAYADFVTAMMAFFLLLWLLSSVPKENLTGIADYFTPTIGLRDQAGIGFQGGTSESKEGQQSKDNTAQALVYGAPQSGAVVVSPNPDTPNDQDFDEKDATNFTAMQNDISKAVKNNPELKDFQDSIMVDITPEGLRIQILDKQEKPMFKSGTAQMEDNTKLLLAKVAEMIKYMPNYISISGHTNSTVLNTTDGYDNWSLSADRANVTRKYLIDGHIDREQIARIVGKADLEPLDPAHPDDTKNIRIAILLMRHSIMPYNKRATPDDAGANDSGYMKNKLKKDVNVIRIR